MERLAPALLRMATGVFLAGVYPPAMKLVANWFVRGRGLALGVLIGAITIGSDSVVGANTVVTKDVPAGSVVTGVAVTARPRSGHEGVPPL